MAQPLFTPHSKRTWSRKAWAFLKLLGKWLRPPRGLWPTRGGKLYLAATLFIGGAAINTGNNLLYLLLGWLLAMIIASGILSELSLRGLSVTRKPATRIYAGRPFLIGVSLHNRKKRVSSFSIEVEDLQKRRPLDKRCYFLKVPPAKEQATSYRHSFPRRGLYHLDGVRLATRFPFGLFRKSLDLELPAELLVYPAVHPVPLPPAPISQGGEEQLMRRGRAGELYGLRDFRQGDDRREIHWRSSAHRGRLTIRERDDDAQRRIAILLDNSLPQTSKTTPDAGKDGQPLANDKPDGGLDGVPSAKGSKGAKGAGTGHDRDSDSGAGTGGDAGAAEADAEATALAALERAVSLAASLAVAYLGRNYAVCLAARGGVFVPPAPGQAQAERILRILALLETASPDSPAPAVPASTGERLLVVPRGVRPSPASSGIPPKVLEA
ncbi:MAG: DUF58 domain-containing protein [Pseudomonadota bacterium]